MRLTTIKSGVIVENVEALIPHLIAQVKEYLPEPDAPLSTANMSYYRIGEHFRNAGIRSVKEWPKKAVEWALKADPRFAKDQKKKKPLDRSKAPFAKHILRWWLDPQAYSAHAPVTMPEDIEIVRENLKRLNVARQQGLHIQPDQLKTWEDVLSALEPFQEEGAVGDFYGEAGYGFPLVFHDGPWKVYHIDKWIDGDINKDNGRLQHKALQDYGWCVKYEGNFRSYSKRSPILLVLLNNRVFALLNIGSKELKNVQNRRKTGPAAEDFVKRYFEANQDEYIQLLLGSLVTRHGGEIYFSAGDFSQFLEQQITTPEIQKKLETPHAKEIALRNPEYIRNLAKLTGDWPNFEKWPEGRKAIIATANEPSAGWPYEEFVRLHGRVPEIEARLRNPDIRVSMKEFMNYYTIIAKSWTDGSNTYLNAPIKNPVKDNDIESLTKLGENIAIQNANWVINGYRGNPLPAEKVKESLHQIIRYVQMVGNLFGKNPVMPPEIDEAVLESNMPRLAFGWARATKSRKEGWPEAERLIGQEQRSAKAYEKYFGRTPETDAEVEIKTPAQAVRHATRVGEIPELENLILSDIDQAIAYSRDIIGPWPDLEEILQQQGTEAQIAKYSDEVLYGEPLQ